jgi:hypothetical protein
MAFPSPPARNLVQGTLNRQPVGRRRAGWNFSSRATANDHISEDRQKNDSRWAPKEAQQRLDLVDVEATWPLIAITRGRGVQAVQQRAQKLGHKVPIRLTTTPK